tara:strand:- start:11 stop:196 length:186 start_codon:yes stop_codon:yes gene_type:complete
MITEYETIADAISKSAELQATGWQNLRVVPIKADWDHRCVYAIMAGNSFIINATCVEDGAE